jgi:hypothetical protein
LSLFADWYPNPADGWHVGTEFGFGLVELVVNSDTLAAGDLTGSIFGGYEWWIGPQWSAGLMLKATGGTRTDLRYIDQGGSEPGPQSGYVLGAGSIALEGTIVLH